MLALALITGTRRRYQSKLFVPLTPKLANGSILPFAHKSVMPLAWGRSEMSV
jgi:hypothetical protein